jgi:LacI family transcriptional regulator/LacI family repressor for deo operon, udp, cdd, tsx, nupC, and nupG
MTSLKKVAARANVSISTCSRVINGNLRVDPEARQRVEKAIRELDYVPNRVAQRLRSTNARKRLVGLVLPDIQNPFYVDVIRGVEACAYEKNFAVMIGNFGQDEARQKLYLDIFKSESVDGLIVAPSHGKDEHILAAIKDGFKVVCIDRGLASTNVDVVKVNNEKGAFAAVEYLIGLGHRRIAHIAGLSNIPTTQERVAGYMSAMKAHGISVGKELLRTSHSDYDSGVAIMQELLDLDDPPTAVFTANNLLTLGALKTIHENDIRIPDDISIVGFDDMYWSDSLNPPLTAVHQSGFDIGFKATELLFERIDRKENHSTNIVFDVTLEKRGSCKSLESD